MAREQTMHKIEQDIAEGKLGIARDRLMGLLLAYPTEIAIRSRLGDVNWMLGYPIEAGRWWYLDEELDERKREAIAAFASRCGDDPIAIYRKLKLRAHAEELDVEWARVRASRLEHELERAGAQRAESAASRVQRNWKSDLIGYGCGLFFLVWLVCSVIGAEVVWRRLTGH